MIRLLIIPLVLIVVGCGMKEFDDVSKKLPDGTTLEFRGVWAETLSQGLTATAMYRCGDRYTIVEVNSLDSRAIAVDVSGCTEVDSDIIAHRSLLAGVAEGLAYSVPGAVADVWASNNIKKGLKQSGDEINNTLEGGNASATGGEAYAEGGAGGAGGAGGTAVVSVTNSNLQSQNQAQSQHQGNINTNVNKPSFNNTNNNVNVNKPTANASATATSAPHIVNNNKPVNVNVNKPTNVFKPTNNGGGNTHVGCRNNCFNTQGNSQGGYLNTNSK